MQARNELTLLQFDGSQEWSLISWDDEFDGWQGALYNIFRLLMQGMLMAIITFVMLNMNFMPPGSRCWRPRAIFSSIGLLVLNFAVYSQMVASVLYPFYWIEDTPWDSVPANIVVSFAAVVAVCVVDVYYIKLFGCLAGCFCFPWLCGRCMPEALKEDQNVSNEGGDSGQGVPSTAGVCQAPVAEKVIREVSCAPEGDSGTSSGATKWCAETQGPQGAVAEVNGSGAGLMAGGRRDEEFLRGGYPRADTLAVARIEPRSAMKRWDTHVLVDRWEDSIKTKARAKLKRKMGKRRNRERLADSGTRAMLRLPSLESISNVRKIWGGLLWRLREAWNAVREEEGKFRYSVWVKTAAFTSLVVQVYFCIKTVEWWYEAVNEWKSFEFAVSSAIRDVADAAAEVQEALVANSTANGNDTMLTTGNAEVDAFGLRAVSVGGMVFLFTGDTIGNIVKYVNTLIPKWRTCIFIGYPLSLPVGVWTLYVVLVQHKKLFLCLGREVELQGQQENGNHGPEVSAEGPWLGVEKKYPIGGAVYFFGVLTSTAVIQIQLFGFLFSLVLAVLANLPNIYTLVQAIGFWVLALLAAVIFNRLVVVLLGNWLFSDGLHIHHPQLFFLYMFIFSMIHLVLGVFHAIVRLALLLLTTLLVLNRLDVTPFTTLRALDGGHNAFMSMLVLAQVIQKNKGGRDEPNVADGASDSEGASKRRQALEHAHSSLTLSPLTETDQYRKGLSATGVADV
eukprot:evm.model.scf_1528.1 EVM.evm.TU.scf_1528.1   scf_1528:11768-14084(+)